MKGKRGKQVGTRCLAVAIAVVLSVAMLWGGKPLRIQAASQNDAVSWANAQINKGLDYDGAYGNQCVDLIKYYYAYFGVAGYAKGNANAYISNALPSGWTRVYGEYQPGDIAVWKVNHSCNTCSTGDFGHVGIIVAMDGTGFYAINQNFNGQSHCTRNRFNTSALACAIRPSYTASGNVPQGCLDTVTGQDGKIYVAGWAFDRDNVNAQIDIHVYIGGPAGSGEGHVIRADKSRPDVGAAYPGVGANHGFADTITTNQVGSKEVYVYAINVGAGGSNTYLGKSAVTIRPASVNQPTATPSAPQSKSGISFADFNQNAVWETNAEMYVKIMNPNKEVVSSVGCHLYDANGTLLKSYSEQCGLSTSYVNYNCNINNDMKYALQPGTTYKFVLYGVVGGKEYRDVMRNFTTSGTSQVTAKPTIKPSPQPTATPTKRPSEEQSTMSPTETSNGDQGLDGHEPQDKTEWDSDEEGTAEQKKSSATVKKPGQVKQVKVKNVKGRAVEVTWKSAGKDCSYQIQIARNRTFAKEKLSDTTSGKYIKCYNATKKKTYYVRVRAYRIASGKELYGKWSTVKKVKIKK